MAKTEVTTVKTRTNANELIRNAVDLKNMMNIELNGKKQLH